MTNDTKGRQLQDARDSGPSFGARTGGKQLRGCRRGASPKSGQTGGTRKTSRRRNQADGWRGNRGPIRRIICSWQEFSLLTRSAARRLHVNDVPTFPVRSEERRVGKECRSR